MGSEIVIRRTRFRETFRLIDLRDGPSLIFVDCVFERGLCARDAAIGHSLTLVGCEIRSLNEKSVSDIAVDLENAHVGGDLGFYDCTIGGRFFATSLEASSDVRLRGCRIAPQIADIGHRVRFDELGIGVDEIGVDRIGKLLDRLHWREASFAPLPAVCLDGATIAGNLEIVLVTAESRKTSRVGEALLVANDPGNISASVLLGGITATGLHVGGSISAFGTLCRGGGIDFGLARCDGSVSFSCSEARDLPGPHLRAEYIGLQGVRIHGSVDLQRAEIARDVTLYGAEITGNVGLLGLHCGGDLSFVFSRIGGFVSAFRTAEDRAPGRRTLAVQGELTLSGADIRGLEMRGIQVGRDIKSITGKFGRLFFSLGVESTDEGTFVPRGCRAANVVLSAITVDETIELAGFQTLSREEKGMHQTTRLRQAESGVSLIASHIGRDLTFFRADIATGLETRWGQPIPWAHGSRPRPDDLDTRVVGVLDLKANVIDGGLDLRHVKVESDIRLNDTRVRLDVTMGAHHGVFGAEDGGLTTTCGRLDAEKLQCDGDLNLSGLRVRVAGGWDNADLSGLTDENRGSVSARGAHIKGEILLMPRDKEKRQGEPAGSGSSGETGPRSGYAWIERELDLTAVHASHLVLSRRNFLSIPALVGSSPPASRARVRLERGTFGRLEIVRPPPDSIDLSRTTINRWEFGEGLVPTAADYISVLTRLEPFDRATWIDVETSLRNQMLEADANRVYREMRWNAKRRSRSTAPKWPGRIAPLLPVTAIAALLFAAWRGFTHVSPMLVLVTLTLTTIPAWTLVDRDDAYGRLLGFGTRAWWPMIPGVALFLTSWLLVFSQPHNVRASSELLGALEVKVAPEVQPHTIAALDITPTAIFGPGTWSWVDSMALTVRYQVPIIPALTHERWEASDHQLPIGVTTEQYALGLVLYSWIAWPLFLVWLAARIVRGRQS
ncbi:MAG: hypothetical protein ACRD2I_12490 [Vicinamibacterales bacterium]